MSIWFQYVNNIQLYTYMLYVHPCLGERGQYHSWNRWGRVGESGATKFESLLGVWNTGGC